MIFKEYIIILQYIIICLCLSFILGFTTWLVYQRPDKEKGTAYECGFNPYGDARSKFEVRYYIVGLLFIIFDLEIIYIFPWVISWWNINLIGKCVMYLFVILLMIGLIYEYSQGAVSLCLIIIPCIILQNIYGNIIFIFYFIKSLLYTIKKIFIKRLC